MQIFHSNGYVGRSVFRDLERVIALHHDTSDRYVAVIADLIRYNTLLSVARAGTGHLGASLSIAELLAEIYFRSFRFSPARLSSSERDIFILSKGHAVPSLYATLAAKGYIQTKQLDTLRRWKGLAGHCDISVPGIEANTGSLGMGVSKAVGYAIARKRFCLGGSILCVIGDGELQEGQCWEALLSAVSFGCDNFILVVDDNRIQTDQFTHDIVRYADLPGAIHHLGFEVKEGNGVSVSDIHRSFGALFQKNGKPKLFFMHTKKGQGVSFMADASGFSDSGLYRWHNAPLSKPMLADARREILHRVSPDLSSLGYSWTHERPPGKIPITSASGDIRGKSLVEGFSRSLVSLGRRNKRIVVLDADLRDDSGFFLFSQTLPERFFEMGIMEQHMCSVASALFRSGYIPVFSSYAAFLTSRANEQLYNAAGEKLSALVVGTFSGVLPATAGKSHPGFRDISCIKNIPGFSFYQPICSPDVSRVLRRYFRGDLGTLLYLRLSLAPSALELSSPPSDLAVGAPHVLRTGSDVVLLGIGPVVLGECMIAARMLARDHISAAVWNHPWLTTFQDSAFREISEQNIPVVVVEDHFRAGGFGESLMAFLFQNQIPLRLLHLAISEFPDTGFRHEALAGFGLDASSIVSAVRRLTHA